MSTRQKDKTSVNCVSDMHDEMTTHANIGELILTLKINKVSTLSSFLVAVFLLLLLLFCSLAQVLKQTIIFLMHFFSPMQS